jgi:hypothetical protein
MVIPACRAQFQTLDKLEALGINRGRPALSIAQACRLAQPALLAADAARARAHVLAPRAPWAAAPPRPAPCPYAGDIKKAKEGGFHTCASLLMSTKKVR